MTSIFDDLRNRYSPATLSVRGENAWGVATKFLTLLQNQIPDEEDRRKLMSAWMKAVKDNDHKKFERALRRYHRSLSDEE